MRPVPTVSGKHVIGALEKKGRYVRWVPDSHHVLSHPSIPDAIPVPVHENREVKRVTLACILCSAGIEPRAHTNASDGPAGARVAVKLV